MCEFISWIEHENYVYFLTDAELRTKEGEKLLLPNVVDDLCGHGAIRAYWPELNGKGIQKECTDFSTPKNFPKEIVKAIKNGKMFRIGQPTDLLNDKGKKAYQEATATAEKAYQEAKAPAYKAYQEATVPAYKAYQEATAPAYKAYQEATATAYKAYQEAKATAEKAYQEAKAPAYKAYQEATAPAEKAYQEATATAFLKIFKKYKIKSWK